MKRLIYWLYTRWCWWRGELPDDIFGIDRERIVSEALLKLYLDLGGYTADESEGGTMKNFNSFADMRTRVAKPIYRNRVVTYRGRPYRIAAITPNGNLILRFELIVHPDDNDLSFKYVDQATLQGKRS